jgi:4-alpha-glucanotransferase
MSPAGIDELATLYGVAPLADTPGGTSAIGEILAALGVDVGSSQAIGESLRQAADRDPPTLRASAGTCCYLPAWLEQRKAWGISVQLYELRSDRNWGIGDFADLAAFCRIAASAHADFVGTNPLHALFGSDPSRCSPFSPSNRLFLNPLYIGVDQIPFYAAENGDAEAAERLRDKNEVDYAAVSALKHSALRRLWRSWQSADQPVPSSARQEFSRFVERSGEPLRRHALFEALSEAMVAAGSGSGWTAWPEELRDVDGPAVKDFARANEDEVLFHCWLQWIADDQLEQCAAAAREAGMRIGIYVDFAVGEAPDGSATWSDRQLCVPGMSVGAPPDMFTANGQDWGLAPVSPLAMTRTDFAAFRRTNDALMRHAGALRIDHVMSLWQLFFVPAGKTPADGAYVRYPIGSLLRILAEQSNRHRTIVIGEDLGHVPPGFRDVMQQAGIFSYRIVYFEKQDGAFIAPEDYPRLALACLSTHDMPTLQGWWFGNDIELRLRHALIDAEAARAQRLERNQERTALVDALAAAGALASGDLASARSAEAGADDLPAAVAVAANRFVAKTPSLLAGVRLADLTGERQQTNLPGTVDSYPNWRLRSSMRLEDLPAGELFQSITRAMAEERPA